MAFKEKDFIEIEYTGKTKDEEIIFDTTHLDVAKEHGLFNETMTYGPVVVCLGQEQILKGLEKYIIGKDKGSYTIELDAEGAFGKRDAKFIQLIPTSKFIKQGIKPVPGLQINIDGGIGVVKTVSGGRTIVDFNNPLAGKEVVYTIKVNKKVDEVERQIESIITLSFRLKMPEMKVDKDRVTFTFEAEFPKEIQDKISEKIKSTTKIKDVAFSFKKADK